MLGGIRLRPKNTRASSRDGNGFLPAPATFRRMKSTKSNLIGFVVLVLFLIWLVKPMLYLTAKETGPDYPLLHPHSSLYTIPSSSKFIYPPIEDAPALKKLGLAKLFKESRVRDSNMPEVEKTIYQLLNVDDDPNPIKQKLLEEEQNLKLNTARLRNSFKNQEKVVYKPKLSSGYPKVVLVTAVDFEMHEMDYLAKIVQNRVNYAHKQNYGIYVRWYQEFVPIMNSIQFLTAKERAKWVRLYCLRAAMFAFPEAEWFWYLDQDSLIANLKVDLFDYLLNKENLNTAALREQPVIPPHGFIKTYKTLQPENVKLVFTQLETKIETNSFLVKNDVVGRGIIEIWSDQLFLNYNNFPHGPDSAITHILQWHPFILSKSVIVPARMINSAHPEDSLPEEAESGDNVHYYPGDLVVQWSHMNPLESDDILSRYSSSVKP